METPLLQTKLYIPPPRPSLVSRPRLIERLNEGLDFGRKLTLISAPAGFGKTTLVSEWVSGCERPVAWLSLDEGDNDPTRFLAYLVAALQTVVPSIGEGALGVLQAPQPPPIESILAVLLNEISTTQANFSTASGPGFILILDDYQVIEATPIEKALTFLLEHLPLQVHLVIVTREDPPLPLARYRVQGQLTELRAAALRFTSAEAAGFLNQAMGLNLSAEEIAALETRTEGWIAGLQMAAISMQGHEDAASFINSFTGSHRFVLDYLVEEVLEQQSKSVRTFLLQTAVLNRLTSSLCDALTGRDDGQATLEMLEQANLFIVPLDEERRWYRYHHLFADLLRRQLRQTRPTHVPTLHIRASEWYHQHHFAGEAIEHALSAEEFERAAHLIEELAETVWGRGEHTKLWSWLKALPAEQVSSRPQLCIFLAWVMFANGQQEAAELSLQAAERALASTPTTRIIEASSNDPDRQSEPNKVTLQGRIATIRAFMASFRGDGPEIIKYARQALEYLPVQDSVWRSSAAIVLGDAHSFSGELLAAYHARIEALKASEAAGNIYLILIASLKLTAALRQQGRLQRVIEICRQQARLATESGLSQTAMAGSLFAVWGEVVCEWNDLDRAIDYVKKGVELSEQGRDVAVLGWSYLCLVRVLFSTRDLIGGEKVIHKMKKIGRESDVPPWITNQLAAWQTRIWLAQNNLEAALEWAQEGGMSIDGELPFLREIEYMALARLLMAQGRFNETTRLLKRLLEAAEAGGRVSRVIELLILQALACQAGGDTTRAMTTLERALTLAEQGGFIRIFVDEGSPMARLLQEAVARGITPDYTRRLLAAFPGAEPEQISPSKTQDPPSELIEPLSERELEVLQHIADGLTNPEIAARLFLSLNTVKVHTRNIYGKLNVHSRTQAIARSQELGLLSPRQA